MTTKLTKYVPVPCPKGPFECGPDRDQLSLVNADTFHQWMDERMQRNYSFQFTRGLVLGVGAVNVLVTCKETGEAFDLLWVNKQ